MNTRRSDGGPGGERDLPMSKTACGQPVRPHELDELLERVWTLREQGKDQVADLLAITPIDQGAGWLEKLQELRLVEIFDGHVKMTRGGEREAEQILRRHRLTERLFADVFHTSEEVWEREACELEHQSVLTEEAVSAVCAFLGHPPTCPHGRPIPRGDCCAQFQRELKPFVIPLTEAELSERYRIVFITPKSHAPLDRLATLGIHPGRDVHVHQRRPSFVVKVGETDVALDVALARDIYVKQIS